MAVIRVIQGPNLNILGIREPDHYGKKDLQAIESAMQQQAQLAGHQLQHFQSNSEADIVQYIQQSYQQADFIIINPAAFTHTSVAIRDALAAVQIPFIEVHLSNVHARESFRKHSYLSDLAVGVICGLADKGYQYALDYALNYLDN